MITHLPSVHARTRGTRLVVEFREWVGGRMIPVPLLAGDVINIRIRPRRLFQPSDILELTASIIGDGTSGEAEAITTETTLTEAGEYVIWGELVRMVGVEQYRWIASPEHFNVIDNYAV